MYKNARVTRLDTESFGDFRRTKLLDVAKPKRLGLLGRQRDKRLSDLFSQLVSDRACVGWFDSHTFSCLFGKVRRQLLVAIPSPKPIHRFACGDPEQIGPPVPHLLLL
jgi:hypothetical protein